MNELRYMVILALDNEAGVDKENFTHIQEICKKYNWLDILQVVQTLNNRFYLGEDDVEDLKFVE